MCYVKSVGFKDIKYDIPMYQMQCNGKSSARDEQKFESKADQTEK